MILQWTQYLHFCWTSLCPTPAQFPGRGDFSAMGQVVRTREYMTYNCHGSTDLILLSHPNVPLIARFMGPTWGPSGADRTQMGPMLAPWTLLSGTVVPCHLIMNKLDHIRKQEGIYRRINNLLQRLFMHPPIEGKSSGNLMYYWVNSSHSGAIYYHSHNSDVIIGAIPSQITSPTIVYPTVYTGADQRKHQSSASLAFVWGIHRWPVNSPHKGPVTRKMIPLDDVIMILVITSSGNGLSPVWCSTFSWTNVSVK